jgi:hypothetical protein
MRDKFLKIGRYENGSHGSLWAETPVQFPTKIKNKNSTISGLNNSIEFFNSLCANNVCP